MEKCNIKIDTIPAIVWGPSSDQVYIFVHGKMSKKEDAQGFAEIAIEKGFQVISFDLPQHGEHYFHSPEQLAILNTWLVQHI